MGTRNRLVESWDGRDLDINQLAFTAEFDAVFSNAALHWVQDHAAVLQNIHRALVP